MKRMKYRLITAMYSIIILIITSTPANHIPRIQILHFDKFVHFSIYFVFGFLLLMAVIEQWSPGGFAGIFISLLIGTTFGAIDEFHQFWIVSRVPSFGDFFADLGGLIVGILLMFFMILYRYVRVKL